MLIANLTLVAFSVSLVRNPTWC